MVWCPTDPNAFLIFLFWADNGDITYQEHFVLMNIIITNLIISCENVWHDFHHVKLSPFPSVEITGKSSGVIVFKYSFTQWETVQL